MRTMAEVSKSRGWWIAGGAIALVVALVIVALARDPVQLDPSTPEGTVQAYVQAIADKDYETAFELLDPDESEGCEPLDLAFFGREEPFTVTLGETDISNATAFVEVTISYGPNPGPFDAGQGGHEELFVLERSDGQWLITNEPWPYFKWKCREG